MDIRRLAVFCGSRPGEREAYLQAARKMGEALATRGIELVYGGGRVGMMGTMADAALAAGGQVIGVIPDALVRKESAYGELDELHIVDSMHERKQMFADLSDGFVALPGGLGTFEELFEIWTWAQLGYHGKPCGVLNADGYFEPLLELVEHAVAEGFVEQAHRAMLVEGRRPASLLDALMEYEPPEVPRWLEDKEST